MGCTKKECKLLRNNLKDLTLKESEVCLQKCEKCCYKREHITEDWKQETYLKVRLDYVKKFHESLYDKKRILDVLISNYVNYNNRVLT